MNHQSRIPGKGGERAKPSHHSVMFLCNNDHGLPTGGVECVEVTDEIKLTCQSVRPKTFRLSGRRLKVGRYHYEHLGSQSCVGNLYWDAATMHVAEARRLIRNLLADGWAVEEHAEEGPFAHLARRQP